MYHIPQSMIKNKINGKSCGINIIDTPGYGDTEGLEKDEKTKRMLHHLFKSFESLDYLIIVSKSSETRMDAFAANVFNEMSQLYAKNVNERILALLTFSDFNLKATNTLALFKKSQIPMELERTFLFNNYFTFCDRNSNQQVITQFDNTMNSF